MKEVLYKSTRSNLEPVSASVAILKGLTEDGGLFVPDHIPALDKSLGELAAMDYREVAYEVMKLYLTDFTEEELTFYWSDEEYQEFLEELKAYTG